jgi:HPt (histidine-containing phosphotransfer) domain-containing protein
MDMEMPVMDGITATRNLRAREAEQGGAHLPVVAMTANALQEDRERCLVAGMDGYLAKPVSFAALQNEIRRLFGSRPLAPEAPAAAAEPRDGAIFDRQAAVAMMGEDSLFNRVAEMFVAEAPGYLAEIDAAMAAGDADQLARVAHTVKGLFATFVAPAGQSIAMQLEKMARTGNLGACSELVIAVRAKVEALSAALAHK